MYSVYFIDGEYLFSGTLARCYWFIAQKMKKGFDRSLFVVVKAKKM